MESLIVLVSPPSLQLFFLLRLLFSFGPSSNIRDGKLTVEEGEEAGGSSGVMARASRLGTTRTKKVELGSFAAPSGGDDDTITNFARRPGERGERERDGMQPPASRPGG